MSGEYGVGHILTGEVLPMRAGQDEPDTLGPEFASTLHEVMQDPWPVSEPEQWTHRAGNGFRNPGFAESLQGADPAVIKRMAVEALIAPVRARRRAGRTRNGR